MENQKVSFWKSFFSAYLWWSGFKGHAENYASLQSPALEANITCGLSLKNLIQGLLLQKNMKPSHYKMISAGDLMKKWNNFKGFYFS